jgi:hypothetical protein
MQFPEKNVNKTSEKRKEWGPWGKKVRIFYTMVLGQGI